MKNNISFTLALASIKKDLKNYIISFVMMFIAFTFTIVFISYITAYEKVDLMQRQKDYGNWLICYEGLNQPSLDFLESSRLVERTTNLSVVGRFSNSNYIANYSSDFFEIASIELLEGRLPETDSEILIKEKRFSIGDTITLSYYNPNKTVETYTVVGKINDYNKKWDTPSVDYFTKSHQEYNCYSYITSNANVEKFNGLNKDCIYNYSLTGHDVSESRGDGEEYFYYKRDGLDMTKNTYINIFIGVISLGIFIAIASNINQREKHIFLLRSLGMSKKDMRIYIFYEIIALVLMTLFLSIIVGGVIIGFMNYMYYLKYEVNFLLDFIVNSGTYLVVLIVIIMIVTYISILPIEIHSMDSLIHKKQRKKLKKYHKASRMTVRKLAKRISNSHFTHIFNIGWLITLQIICIIYIVSNYQNYITMMENQDYSRYEYSYNLIDDKYVETIKESVIDYNTYKKASGIHCKYSDASGEHFGGNYYSFENMNMEYQLVKGRMPTNKYECVYFHNPNSSYLNDEYYVGRKVILLEEEYNESIEEFEYIEKDEVTIVGQVEIDMGTMETNNDRFNDGLILNDEILSKKSWQPVSYIRANKDIYLDIKNFVYDSREIIASEASDHYMIRSLDSIVLKENYYSPQDSIHILAILVTLLVIATFFIVINMKLLINKINKDLKLMRCLGLTFLQSIRIYMWTTIGILIFPICILILYINEKFTFNNIMIIRETILLSVIIANIVLFIIMAFSMTSRHLEFYPSEVERYY